MKRIIVLALVTFYFSTPCKCQFVSKDEVPPTSGCRSLFTYNHGINLDITVLANTKESSSELERAMAKDISRFKDTGQITGSNDAALPLEQMRPIRFEATVFWTELQIDGKTSGYAAAAFFFEICATHGNGRGFSTQLLTVESLAVQPTKEKLLDYVEKNLYDALIAEVNRRRASTKMLANSPKS